MRAATGSARAARAAAVLVGVAAPLTACTPPAPMVQDHVDAPVTSEYREGLPATVHRPGQEPAAVVVLVPGGGWSSAEPAGLGPLAEALRDAGLAAVTITYGTDGSGAHFPEPVDDVRCAVAFAAAQVPDVPVILLGHSAGAHLSALAALDPEPDSAGRGDCTHPNVAADAVVGLAGPYDVSRTGSMAENLFGVPQSRDPESWAAGNPLLLGASRPEVPVLLLHGEDDDVVPASFASDFAAALAGHDVTVELLPGVDHSEIIRPETVADSVNRWVTATVLGG